MVAAEKTDMGKVTVKFRVTNNADRVLAGAGVIPADQVRHVEINGVVDTGAMLVLPEWAVKQLGLPKSGETKVRYADHRSATRDIVTQVEAEVLGRRSLFDAIVEPGRPDALVGAIVLEALDLLVDCKHTALVPRDPDQILTEID